jgi:glycerol-3-phosphate acyltransferase PlsY
MPESSLLGPPAALVLAFLIGSIPTAFVMGKLKGIDIRQHGSGNVGATNAFRVLGKAAGVACLIIDVLKGWFPAFVFSAGAWRPETMTRPTWMLVVGLAAIAGHSFSPWVGFKGGKGVATSLGVFLAVSPLPMLICLALGIAIIAVTGYVSLASITGAALLPILMIVLPGRDGRHWTVIILAAALGAFVIWRHRANIKRLLAGTESRIFQAKPAGPQGGNP